MKELLLILCSLFILISCGLEETNDQFAQEKQKEMIKADPLFANYLKAVETQAKLTTESKTLDLHKYSEIIKNKNNTSHVCDIDKRIFEGDTEMEALADLHCKTSIASKAFKNKYPFISKMTNRERLAFFKDFDIRYNYDVEVRKEKARKVYEQQENNDD